MAARGLRRAGQGGLKLVQAHRLGEHDVHAGCDQFFLVGTQRDRGQQYQARRCLAGVVLYQARQGEDVVVGQGGVENHRVEHGIFILRGMQPRQCLCAGSRRRAGDLPEFVLVFQDGAAIGVAANDQDAQPAQARVRRHRVLGLFFQAQPEPEGAALPGAAVDADFTAHHLSQLFGDDQAEPGTAVPAGG